MIYVLVQSLVGMAAPFHERSAFGCTGMPFFIWVSVTKIAFCPTRMWFTFIEWE